MIAQLNQASKVYQTPAGTFTALDKTTLTVNEAELLLIIGPSGSGKTTLLSLIGCLIEPTEGSLMVDGHDVAGLSAGQMANVRLNTIGFVFQQFNLLAPLTAEENVAFPLRMQSLSRAAVNERTTQALANLNMLDHRRKFPKQLSGGQQQRIAIARALVTNPKLILCDEPTASLDKDSVGIVMDELRTLARSGKAVAVVTHDPRLTPYADRAVEVKNGIVTPIDIHQITA
ncbi:ABC transporter ATP-binding protein [Spirosoma montaniterrae]|uniref:Macrolide ABC transporter ATP-binding protein n=1 Tax=Spirosoma montaniterrae TaxID=1178516 RepID=A0A1P9X280_9BACT|nr:ABC transporter ATP-binding protein [Spirosoma montaniterrae]AQG81736.1 macrolide ABC transporter ATP-binding protein [Spirosoma montaniterrae]